MARSLSKTGRSRVLPVACVGLVWLALVAFGADLLLKYANSPGDSGAPPAQWPADSALKRTAGLPTLLVFMHPKCPCSKATVGELALLMAHCQGRVNAHVIFVQPDGAPADWTDTANWHDSAAIPGVAVDRDQSGAEAHRFKMETSGDTLLYDRDNRLVFHGGITISRGHSGDNPGRASLQEFLLGEPPERARTPAFGCSLFSCPAAPN
jgi:hypothetical protein